MNYIKQITNYLETCEGKTIDVLFELYTILDSLECNDQINAFQFICENNRKIESDGSNVVKKKYFTEKQIDKSLDRLYSKKIIDVIHSLVIDSIKNDIDAKQFYKKLWQLIHSTKICKSKRDRVLALYFVIDSELIPYQNVGFGKIMDESTYRDITDHLDPNLIEEIEYIINLNYEQKTQISSLLLERLLSINDKDQRIVLLSIIIDVEKSKTKRMLQNYINKI